MAITHVLAEHDYGERDPRAPGRVTEWSGAVVACGVAGSLALIAMAMGWRGRDLPAQVFRVELFHRAGFVMWNNQWFSGVPTPNYSVLSPALAAVTGPIALCAASCVASAFLFQRLVQRGFGTSAWVGSLWFAASTVTSVVVGRVTFAIGLVFLLGALVALQHHRVLVAAVCGLLCALVSPVAGVFLAVIAGGWGLARPSSRAGAWLTGAIAIGPVLAIAALFPTPGAEPYEWWALACDLALCALLWVTVPDRFLALRYGVAVYAVLLIATKVVASPLGGNVSRLNQYAAGPLLACVLWEHRRALVLAIAVPLLFWQWFPAVDAIVFARADPSTHRAYYEPLLRYLDTTSHTFGRIEIPDTSRHWEAAYVAPQFPLARGWERQLDYAYDAAFYDNRLTATTYEHWLSENGVQYVALPDAPLDSSSFVEAKLIKGGVRYLQPVWHDAHWHVFRFLGYRGLVDGPAQLTDLGPADFTLHVTGPGVVTVHIHDSPHWAVQGAGCTSTSPGDWIELHNLLPGTVRIAQAFRGTRCDTDQ